MTGEEQGVGGDWEDDMLRELTEAGRLEAVPIEVVAAAKSAYARRTMDAELAELAYDSDVAEDAMAGLRGATTDAPRALTFEAARLTVELEVVESGGGRRLLGQLVPPQAGRVEVRHPAGTIAVDADEVGRFTLSGLGSGPVSLRCHAHGAGGIVETDWVLL